MERRFKIVDLFCGEGGASAGLAAAGFEVVGVDSNPKCGKRYPFEFVCADALTFDLTGFDAVWASPVCKGYSKTKVLQPGKVTPLQIEKTREKLEASGLPYIMENVDGAPLQNAVMLCGLMFGLLTTRHRWFESNFALFAPAHPRHVGRKVKMGRMPQEGDLINPAGHFAGVDYARKVLGVEWMSQQGIAECVPPKFAEYVGGQLLAILKRLNEAAA